MSGLPLAVLCSHSLLYSLLFQQYFLPPLSHFVYSTKHNAIAVLDDITNLWTYLLEP